MRQAIALPAMLITCLFAATAAAKDVGIVRLEAKGPNGRVLVYSTGTHIGDGLILTCTHCCRASGGRGAKAVAHVPDSKALTLRRKVPVTVLCYEKDADVGLMRCDDPNAIETAYQLAPRGYEPPTGSLVFTYGWKEQGRTERLYSSKQAITAVNRYLGSANIEITGVPAQGMSGGPLVMAEGRLIVGVTIAADPANRRGICCGLEPIYLLLEHAASHPLEIRVTSGEK